MIARTWFRRIRFRTRDPEIFQALRYLECDPEIVAVSAEDRVISIEPYRAYYRIEREGRILREQMSPRGVADFLHAELAFLSLADFPDAPLIHAASLRCNGRRILLVGPKGGGKTTLTLRLIQEGYEIEGDENVFVTAEGVVSRPRALRVKDSTAAFFPALAEIIEAAPYYENRQNLRTYNLDPRRAGAQFWRIERGAADVVVLVRPNHGGYSSLRPIPPLPLVREVMAESAFPETGRAQAIANITKAIGKSRGFDLSLGDLDSAVSCFDRAFRQTD